MLHPIRMMLKMDTEAEKIAAVLHDVVEDTDWTFEKLAAEGFSDEDNRWGQVLQYGNPQFLSSVCEFIVLRDLDAVNLLPRRNPYGI